jgi:hypothetical protein
MDYGGGIAAVLDAENFLPVGGWGHVVPGFESGGERADV